MKTELQRAACRGALMAPTREMKNVDRNDEDDRKKRLAQLIRDNVRPKGPGGAFEMLELLARLDAKRLKLIADIVAATRGERQGAGEGREVPRDFIEGYSDARESRENERLHGVLSRIDCALGEKSRRYVRANERILDASIEARKEERREKEPGLSSRALDDWADILIAELESRNDSTTPRRRRRRTRPSKPTNVVLLAPRAAKETIGSGGDGPKAAS